MRAIKFVMRVVLVGWFVGLGITFLAMLLSGSRATEPPEPVTAVQAAQDAASRPYVPSVGEVCSVSVPCYLGRDWESHEEVTRLAVANDTMGIGALTIQGKVETLDAGTQVNIIELHFTACRVRVLDGRHAGLDGYVPRDFVKPL